jgi:tRNA 2-thiouridine synthesizing protein A
MSGPRPHVEALTSDKILDLRGLKCPLPALFARRALAGAAGGQILTVLTDDPMAPIDVPHMCQQEGYEVLAVQKMGNNTKLVLRRL